MFPITTPKQEQIYKFYEIQQKQLWLAKEIHFKDDREKFDSLLPRYKQLYCDLLAFFSPGDGLVNANVRRFAEEADDFTSSSFYDVQMYIERVHSEAYGLAIVGVIKDEKLRNEVYNAVDVIESVNSKALYIKRYIEDKNCTLSERYIASACTEGIFFVTLFSIIFYMRSKNIMNGFIFLNEQVAKDETLHRDFYCYMASQCGEDKISTAKAHQIIDDAVEIEMEHLRHILRDPIDSEDMDRISGLTIKNLELYAKGLGNDILMMSGYDPLYDVNDVTLPWMNDMAIGRKTNFYEGEVGNYRKTEAAGNFDINKVETMHF